MCPRFDYGGFYGVEFGLASCSYLAAGAWQFHKVYNEAKITELVGRYRPRNNPPISDTEMKEALRNARP